MAKKLHCKQVLIWKGKASIRRFRQVSRLFFQLQEISNSSPSPPAQELRWTRGASFQDIDLYTDR